MTKLKKLFENKVSSKILGLFRIFFFIDFFLEISRFAYFKELIFDRIPFFHPADIDFGFIFLIWKIAIFCVIIGFRYRFFVILNYLMALAIIATTHAYEYHMFYVYMMVNFLMMFIPANRSYSVDNILYTLNNDGSKQIQIRENKTREINYYIILFFAVGLVYLESLLHKLPSKIWQNGVAVWLPSSYPNLVNFDLTPFLNLEYLNYFLSYLTLVFEFLYIFLFWRKRAKAIFLLIGLGLHIGILITYPIPQFAVGMITLYILMLPLEWPDKLKLFKPKSVLRINYNELNESTKKLVCFFKAFDFLGKILVDYDSNSRQGNESGFALKINGEELSDEKLTNYLASKTWLLFPLFISLKIPYLKNKVYLLLKNYVENVMWRKRINNSISDNLYIEKIKYKTVASFLILALILQMITSLRSPLCVKLFSNIRIYNSVVERTGTINYFSKAFFGIYLHGVFVDWHFNGYNHNVRVDYIDENGKHYILPMIDEKGMAGAYLKGFIWAKWTFRVNGPKVNNQILSTGIQDFTAFWLFKEGVANAKTAEGLYNFKIYVQYMDGTTGFQKDFLRRQINKPWKEIGTATWDKKQFTIDIPRIESITE